MPRITSFVLCAVLMAVAASNVFAMPFDMAVRQGADSSFWTYTLTNHDTSGSLLLVALDLNWTDNWEESQSPQTFSVTATPEGWVENSDFPWPAWDAIGNTPSAGHSLPGFELSTGLKSPALYYRVWYTDFNLDFQSQSGVIPFVPEPASIFTLLAGLSGMVLYRKRK